ncbi:protein of unknown function [Bradyrhizobium vignae]|uniref:Uncharacterized protein n=1 Tax=Bradyrhizobium vignae TaxID=1549949 RepID=A0A2U3Q6D3_9BRAD|nr:protein of unknown function [Bradyrhizobium vignae]
MMKQASKEAKMPTYVCSLAEGFVNDSQKAAIAEAVTRIHRGDRRAKLLCTGRHRGKETC